jgi:hypothetical protein
MSLRADRAPTSAGEHAAPGGARAAADAAFVGDCFLAVVPGGRVPGVGRHLAHRVRTRQPGCGHRQQRALEIGNALAQAWPFSGQARGCGRFTTARIANLEFQRSGATTMSFKGQVTIPRDVRERPGLQAGD